MSIDLEKHPVHTEASELEAYPSGLKKAAEDLRVIERHASDPTIPLDSMVGDYVSAAGRATHPDADEKEQVCAAETGEIAVFEHPNSSPKTAAALDTMPVVILAESLGEINDAIGPAAVSTVMAAIDAAGHDQPIDPLGHHAALDTAATMLGAEAGLQGSVEASQRPIEQEVVPEILYTKEEIAGDINERLALPMEQRKGTEVIDQTTGEVRRPCIEVYCDDTAKQEVAASLAHERQGLDDINALMDAIEAKFSVVDPTALRNFGITIHEQPESPVPVQDIDRCTKQDILHALDSPNAFVRDIRDRRYLANRVILHPDICVAIFGREGVAGGLAQRYGLRDEPIEVEGNYGGGDLSDLYWSEDDIEARKKLAERVGAASCIVEPTQLASPDHSKRVQAAIDTLLPSGSELFHTTRALEDILASGQFASRVEAGVSGGTETGNHSNFIHFGEPYKINGNYGSAAISVTVDQVVQEAPYLQQESQWGRGEVGQKQIRASGMSWSQHLCKVEIPTSGDTAFVVRQRIATLRQRCEDGVWVQGSKGDRNNFAFAATQDRETAARYGFNTRDCMITIEDTATGHIDVPRETAWLMEQYGYDETWQAEHVRSIGRVNRLNRSNVPFSTHEGDSDWGKTLLRTELQLDLPVGIQPDRVVGYMPASTTYLDWDERGLVPVHSDTAVEFTQKPTVVQRAKRDKEVRKAEELRKAEEAFAAEAAALGLSVEGYREKLDRERRDEEEAKNRASAEKHGMTYEAYMALPVMMRPGASETSF